MDLQKIGCCSGRVHWLTFVNTLMNLQVPHEEGNFLSKWVAISFSRWTKLHGDN